MKFGKKYWVIVAVFALIVVGFGIARYSSGISGTGLFLQGTASPYGIGDPGARHTIDFFCDYQNYYCLKANELAQKLSESDLNVFFRFENYPVSNRPFDFQAAVASSCSAQQGLFLEVHNQLLADNYSLSEEKILQIARDAPGLNFAKFNDCYSSQATKNIVLGEVVDGQNKGVDKASVPAFVYNGKIAGGTNMDAIEQEITSWLK